MNDELNSDHFKNISQSCDFPSLSETYAKLELSFQVASITTKIRHGIEMVLLDEFRGIIHN